MPLPDAFVAFYSFHERAPGSLEDRARLNATGNPRVIAHLADFGIGAFFMQGQSLHGLESSTPTAVGRIASMVQGEIRCGDATELPIGAGGVTAVRARCASPPLLSEHVPVVNDAAVRQIGRSKWRQYNLFAEHMALTYCFEPGQPVDWDLAASLSGLNVILKSDRSKGGEGVASIAKLPPALVGAERYLREQYPHASVLLQQEDYAEPLPGLRSLNPNDQWLLEEGLMNNELRVLTLATRHNSRSTPVMRVQEGVKFWLVPIDPESMPEEALALGNMAPQLIMERTAAPALVAATDVYCNPQGQWRIREVNLQDPGFVGSQSGRTDLPHLRLHADQLAELALQPAA